jgi:hypothetical protein
MLVRSILPDTDLGKDVIHRCRQRHRQWVVASHAGEKSLERGISVVAAGRRCRAEARPPHAD